MFFFFYFCWITELLCLLVHACVLFLHAHTPTNSLICLFLSGISSQIMSEARLPCCVCKPESGGTSDDVGSDLASLPVSFSPVLMLLWRSSCSVSSSPLEKTVNKPSLSFSLALLSFFPPSSYLSNFSSWSTPRPHLLLIWLTSCQQSGSIRFCTL